MYDCGSLQDQIDLTVSVVFVKELGQSVGVSAWRERFRGRGVLEVVLLLGPVHSVSFYVVVLLSLVSVVHPGIIV